MKWIKRGVIYTNPQRAQMPTALVMPDRIRIYYNIRDKKQRARIHFIDVDKNDPKKIIGESRKEVLPLGKRGAFDDAGVMPGAIEKIGDYVVLYYSGFSLSKNVPYKVQIGRAIRYIGDEFFEEREVYKSGSNLATTPALMEGTPMLCAFGVEWINVKDKLEPTYLIGYGDHELLIKPKYKHEAQCRPSVIKINNTYHMWFCYRDSFDFRGGKGSYRIGYASSKDGIKWKRDDRKAGITIGKKGEWDSEMIAYPNIVEVNGKYLMFYNGNGFGQSGIGYAELKK